MKKIFDMISMFFLSAIFVVAVSFSNINAQSRIMETIGGSGSNTENVDSKSDNTFLYLAGGLVLGYLVYQIVVNKSKSKEKSEKESGDAEKENKSLSEELKEFQDETPVLLHLGIENNQFLKNQKQFVMGVSFKL